MYKNTKQIVLSIGMAFFLLACKKGVKNPDNDAGHSPITTLTLTFKQGSTTIGQFVFDDPDGAGGANPLRFDTIKLAASQNYTVAVTLADKTKTPAVDMTQIIKDAGHQHRFFYIPSGISGINIGITDLDKLGYPIGIESNWQTGSAAPQNGTLKVMLRHLAFGKSANNAPTDGHADIQIDFPVKIQ
jgi:hypothetical protein